MPKTFVLDTNVLLLDPKSITKFPGQKVVIPITVLEELDDLKRLQNDIGRNARTAIRYLDSLKEVAAGNLNEGIRLENESTIHLQIQIKADFNNNFALSVNDNRIVLAAYLLKDRGEDVTFVSKDFGARLKAEAIGLKAEDYKNYTYAYESLSPGLTEQEVDKRTLDLFRKEGSLSLPDLSLPPNGFCHLKAEENNHILAKNSPSNGHLIPLLPQKELWGISPRNVEQRCAIDLLLRDEIKLVSLIGPAGTGKTLLALACALRKVFDEDVYSRLLVSRPIVPLGRDIGYLPGTKEEKLYHWMQPIHDNLEFLCQGDRKIDAKDHLSWILDHPKLEMEAVTYIRGRTLPNMFIIIDEAQNLTPHEMKTIISRAGDGTKVVLTGDPTQIDNPYLDKDSNGLTYAAGRFSDQSIFGNLFLTKTERSELAAIATQIL